jgi:hypothetical protein
VAALVGTVLIGQHSDGSGERQKHVVACAITAAIGLALAARFQNRGSARQSSAHGLLAA